jgi:hypothetical protein
MSPFRISVAGLSSLLSLVCLACGDGGVEPPTQTMAHSAGDGQSAIAGSAVSTAPAVAVKDANNNPVAGIPVTFQVTSGGGTVVPTTPVTTDEQGTATVTSWMLGTTPGANTLSASAPGVAGSPVVFTATGLAEGTIRGIITISDAVSGSRARFAGTRQRLIGRSLPRSSSPRQPQYSPDELIVRFRPGAVAAPSRDAPAIALRASATRVSSAIRTRMGPLLSAHSATLAGVSPAISAARIRVQSPADLDRVAAALRMDPAVATVERNGITWAPPYEVSSAGVRRLTRSSNDPLSPLQAWHYGMIDLPQAWSMTTGSASVLVAVIGDGIRFDHPDVAANLTSDGYDFVQDITTGVVPGLCSGGPVDFAGDGDGYDNDPTIPTAYEWNGECLEGPLELGGVGLGRAGIIGAAGNNGMGLSGVNWTVRIRPIRVIGVYGSGFTYDVVQGILYAAGLPADDGAGGVVQAPVAASIIYHGTLSPQDDGTLRDAVLAATNAGVLIIAGAGNNESSDPMYPAAYPEVLSSSAVGPDRKLASYSSFGSTIDIAAPGGDYDGVDPTLGTASTFWDFKTSEPVYAFTRGSGVAAAHVVGVASLLLAQEPGLSASELRSRLTDYAVDAGSPGRDNEYGAGILNARNSLAKNSGPPRQLHVRLYDALTGHVAQTAAASADGSYSLTAAPGSYQVFAGQDESGDGLLGLPGRRWGAFGGSAKPSTIQVAVGESQQASFTVGFPSEREPNETSSEADALPVGGYLSGVVSAAGGGDTDVSRVLIPQAGEYTFETSGVDGACGFALQENTTLRLYAQDETERAVSEDIDAANQNFCSRISSTLQPGTYYLRVQGLRGPNDRYGEGGLYQIQARSGP